MEKQQCIRVLADVDQINGCIRLLQEVDDNLTQLSSLLRLAGNPIRLKILYLLHNEKQLCVCDLSDILDLSVSAISQHLRKLKDGQLVQSKKTGQTIFYQLNPEYRTYLTPILHNITEQQLPKTVDS
jgi:DNA-binding transcriptional ArsR family regulator